MARPQQNQIHYTIKLVDFQLILISPEMIRVLTILALTLLTTSKMIVQSPSELVQFFAEKYQNGDIPYSIANYGNVPYGKTLSGQMGIPNVLEDCVFEELPDSDSSNSKRILLVERNDCSFTQKSINVQKQGGKLAVIMDNLIQDPKRVVMIDDGRGAQVSIPSVLIGMQDGMKLLQFLRSGSVVISVSFQVVVQQKAQFQMWIDIADHQNFVFLRNLQPFFNKVKQYVNFSIAYPTKPCSSSICSESDCFYNQTYCRTDFKYYGVENKGQLLIKQQLRQFFIHRTSADKWWDYVLLYDEHCTDLATVDSCSEKIMRKSKVDPSKINMMVQSSFANDDNQILKKLSDLKIKSSIIYFPTIAVNSIIYRGNLQPFEVYQLICSSLKEQPEECTGLKPSSSKTLSTWIIFVIILVTVFGIFLIVCFRRIARRQVAEKINNHVNELVNQYITMYENDRFNEGTQMPPHKTTNNSS